MNLPRFFIDDSDSMKYEETIDFFMSWTIRCADIKYKDKEPLIYKYSHKILIKLLNCECAINPVFSAIKVWKQHKNIDLWVELKVNNKEYALILEDKMYSKIHSNQLQRYKEIAANHYKVEGKSTEIKYALLRPDYESDIDDQALGIVPEYNYINLEQLAECMDDIKTGNHLFDEFWFNWAIDSQVKRAHK